MLIFKGVFNLLMFKRFIGLIISLFSGLLLPLMLPVITKLL